MKHTPGPWMVDEAYPFVVYARVKGKEVYLADCDIAYSPLPPKEPDANARLIAAAPELLEALKALLQDAGEGRRQGRALDLLSKKYIDMARSTITKAEGKKED